jgi:hypothetical protein
MRAAAGCDAQLPEDFLNALGFCAGADEFDVVVHQNDARLTFALELIENPEERRRATHLVRYFRTLHFLATASDVDAPDEHGFIRLAAAAAVGDFVSTELLVQAGANPRAPDARGLCAIEYATRACRSVCPCWGVGCPHEAVLHTLRGAEPPLNPRTAVGGC